MIARNPVVALSFLQWFKTLFDKKNNGREYHALQARGGQSMSMASAESGGRNYTFLSRENSPILLLSIYFPFFDYSPK